MLKEDTFDSIVPLRYISFDVPTPSLLSLPSDYLSSRNVRISILDSHVDPCTDPPKVGAMVIPKNRETDWIFSTKAGHTQLIGDHGFSRLILIGNAPSHENEFEFGLKLHMVKDPGSMEKLPELLHPLLVSFLPKINRELGVFDLPFLIFEDELVSLTVLEKTVGRYVGEMVVEDIETEARSKRDFRRRLRFKRMPNLVQTEIRLMPRLNDEGSHLRSVGEVEIEQPDLRELVHLYLEPMVASTSLISGFIQRNLDSGVKPRALCIGVGGGALVGFLASQLGFEVMGVELDEVVLRVGKQYFGLDDRESVSICVGDGIQLLSDMARTKGSKQNICPPIKQEFDVVMVDLDPSDCTTGNNAPPLEYLDKRVLLGAKCCLAHHGLVVLNVISSSSLFFDTLVRRFEDVFVEVFQIDTGNGENFVVIGTASPVKHIVWDDENGFLKKLTSVLKGSFADDLRIMCISRGMEEVQI